MGLGMEKRAMAKNRMGISRGCMKKILVAVPTLTLLTLSFLLVGCAGKSSQSGESAGSGEGVNKLLTFDLGKANVQVPEGWNNVQKRGTKAPGEDATLFLYDNHRADIAAFFSIVNDPQAPDPFGGINSLIDMFSGDDYILKKETRDELIINGINCERLDYEVTQVDDNGRPLCRKRFINTYYPDLGLKFVFICSPILDEYQLNAMNWDREEIERLYPEYVDAAYSIINSISMN